MEFDKENRSTGGAIARAKRDIRDEGRARRVETDLAKWVDEDTGGAKDGSKTKA